MSINDNERVTRASVVKSSVIPAGGTFPLEQYGERFYFINATAGIFVRADQGVNKPYRKGTGEDFRLQNLTFSRLEISNPNSFNVYVQVWVGFGEYIDTTTELVELYTQYFARAATSIPALTSVVFNGEPSGIQLQRKGLYVTNMDLANPLLIMDVDPITNLPVNVGTAVFYQTSVFIACSGKIAVRNNTASSIQCYISELWYTYATS